MTHHEDIRTLADAGLAAKADAGGWIYSFSECFFGSDARDLFDDYRTAVDRHEASLDRRRSGEDVDPALIRALDGARSRCHNALASHISREHPLREWDHERYRRWVAAMTRQRMPWLTNRILTVTAESTRAIASLLEPGRPEATTKEI